MNCALNRLLRCSEDCTALLTTWPIDVNRKLGIKLSKPADYCAFFHRRVAGFWYALLQLELQQEPGAAGSAA